MGGAYSEELLKLYIGKGMKLMLAGNDLPMLTGAARAHQAKVRAFQIARAKAVPRRASSIGFLDQSGGPIGDFRGGSRKLVRNAAAPIRQGRFDRIS